MMTSRVRIAATVALAGLALLGGCARKHPAAASAPPRAVTVAVIAARPFTGGLEASGVLISREEAAVYPEAPLNGFRVSKVLVEPDARVSAGQPLAILDDTLLKSQIAQQTALVAQSRVAAEQARDQAERVKGLDTYGVMSAEQIQQRRFQARASDAALQAQTAVLKDLQTRDERMVIRAPVAGLVLERNVRPGDVASSAANPMFRLARDSLIELEAQTPEASLGGLKVGDAVDVALPDGAHVVGKIRLVYPSVDPQTKLGKVRIALPPRPDLRPGGFGRAIFTGAERDVVSAPETAIRYDADGPTVMVVDPDNHVRQLPIKTGARSAGFVEIVSGPPAGAHVLLGASSFVLPGDVVKPELAADASSGLR